MDVVYFVRRGALVKIGTTGGLRQRVGQLNSGSCVLDGMDCDEPVDILAVMPGGRPVERSLHALFASLRYEQEWFHLEEPLVSFIEATAQAASLANARRARAFPDRPEWLGDPREELLTLREAIDEGILPWRHEAVKKRYQRAGRDGVAPQPRSKRKNADLFRASSPPTPHSARSATRSR